MAVAKGIVLTDQDYRRFMSKIDARSENECWYWRAGKVNGYGVFRVKGKYTFKSNQLVIAFSTGNYERETLALHSRDCTTNALRDFNDGSVSRSCCNPRHIRIGTNKENSEDTMKTGMAKGLFTEGQPGYITNRKLSDQDIQSIRRDKRPQSEIARGYGVNQSTVSRIKRLLRWSNQ